MAESSAATRDISSQYASLALSLLANVAAGTSELLVGDDIATGTPAGAELISAVVVQKNTTSIQAALQLKNGVVTAFTPRIIIDATDPNDLRSYDATDGVLIDLHTTSGAATVTRSNVRQALAGDLVPKVASVVGAVPVGPVAMTWNGFEQSLYVVDVVPDGCSSSFLRLLRIGTVKGVAATSTELWRTTSFAEAPSGIFLSTTANDEVVLGISKHGNSEAIVLNAAGEATASTSVRDHSLLQGPAATASVVSLPLARASSSTETNLLVHNVSRHDLAAGLCDAPWLQEHARHDSSLVPPHSHCGCQ